jgi:aspartyl-tRNA(Asn)/glutamyl-tRNA(Gln) amidotransferase subunit C
MSVTLKDVEHVAQLARLDFSPEEKQVLLAQLNTILEYMNQLNRLETSSVEPLLHVIELATVFREDHVRPSTPRDEVLKNAPARSGEFFQVPPVLGER